MKHNCSRRPWVVSQTALLHQCTQDDSSAVRCWMRQAESKALPKYTPLWSKTDAYSFSKPRLPPALFQIHTKTHAMKRSRYLISMSHIDGLSNEQPYNTCILFPLLKSLLILCPGKLRCTGKKRLHDTRGTIATCCQKMLMAPTPPRTSQLQV